jgi:hypothetical protein
MKGSQFSLKSRPLSLFRFIGCLRISISSLIRHLKRCSSLAKLLVFSRRTWCLVLRECSARAEVRMHSFFMSNPCSLILVWKERPVSPM